MIMGRSIIFLSLVLFCAESHPQETSDGTNLTETEELKTRYYGATKYVLTNITRKILTHAKKDTDWTGYTICPRGQWINSINLTFQRETSNLIGIDSACVKVPHGIGDPGLRLPSQPKNTTNGTEIEPENGGSKTEVNMDNSKVYSLRCEAPTHTGSFASGLAANLRNRPVNKYNLHVVYEDVKLICGGQEAVNVKRYNWVIRCEDGAAMCAIDTQYSDFDSVRYTTGIVIGCCAVPQLHLFSASILEYKQMSGLYSGSTKYPQQTSLCMGGDFIHQIRMTWVKNTYEMNFECGTLLTRENKYDLIDNYRKSSPPTGSKEGKVESRNTTCLGYSIVTGIARSDLNWTSWKPICQPTAYYASPQITNDTTGEKFECPRGTALCGVQGNPVEGSFKLVCCPVTFTFCEAEDADEPIDTSHCNVLNGNASCAISYEVGRVVSETRSTPETEEILDSDINEFEKEAGGSFMFVKVEVSVKLKFEKETKAKSSSKEVKTESKTKTVTANITTNGGRLVAKQMVTTCGGTKDKSGRIQYVILPTNVCQTRDELIEIPYTKPNRSEPNSSNQTTFTLYGVGLRWNTRPKQNIDHYVPSFDVLKEGVFKNFYMNVELNPSPVTTMNWADKRFHEGEDIWKKYNKDAKFPATVDLPEYSNPKFYRVVGHCGRDWTVATKTVVAMPSKSSLIYCHVVDNSTRNSNTTI